MHTKVTSIHYDTIATSGLMKVSGIISSAPNAAGSLVQWTVPLDIDLQIRKLVAGTCPLKLRED